MAAGGATTWDEFVQQRDALMRAFAATVSESVARTDTDHPAFHGCYDWHSAVHGTYALLAASRLTGDASYREVAMRETGEDRVAREVTALVDGKLDIEIPYGVGWALILDTEAARNGIRLFRDLAYASRDRLVGHFDRLTAAAGALAAAACHEE